MIKTTKTIPELELYADAFYSKVELIIKVSETIESKLNLTTSLPEADFYLELHTRCKEIITAKPAELDIIAEEILPLYLSAQEDRLSGVVGLTPEKESELTLKFRDEVLDVFGYKKFVAHNHSKWAYSHSAMLDMMVCPYCNMQYTFTLDTVRGKTRPHFDHFINKSNYPYLSISFFNLIPSCYVCNSSFKSKKDFFSHTHVHPFVEDIQDTLIFKTGVKKVEFLSGKTGFDLKLHPVPAAAPDKQIRAENSCKVFHIDELYKNHLEYAGEIIKKGYVYTDTKVKEIYRGFPNLFKSEEEILETIFGNYLLHEKLHKRPLSKLTKDIFDELEVRKSI